MLGMRTFGGRRASACAPVLVTALLSAALLGGCSGAIDQAHSLQTRLNRIDDVGSVSVTTPTPSNGAAIEVVYNGDPTARELTRLIRQVDVLAVAENYPSYRLDLVPARNDGDRLTVDDTFAASPAEETVLQNWLDTTSILLGDLHYVFEPGSERISVDAGAGILHDVGEASRIGYGTAITVWTFADGDDTFTVTGRVTSADVVLFQDVQSGVSSDVLPAPAESWMLLRGARQVLLDLVVGFPDGPVPPEQVTVPRYGDAVGRLATAATTAVDTATVPVTIRLINPTADGQDVFAVWHSDQAPVRGRDPLFRGWDLWFRQLAG